MTAPIVSAGIDGIRMDKPARDVAQKTVKEPVKEPAQNPAVALVKEPGPTQPPVTEPKESSKAGNVNIEAFAHNLARMIEEGGKALAAYMKPREEGKFKGDLADDVTDVVKTVGYVAEYWLSDPKRAVELQASLGRA